TGLIKTVLQLHHKRLVPSVNYRSPSSRIDFANSPFYVNSRLQDWASPEGPRRAGVSSFGIGGTNAHVIVEEAPESEGRQTHRESRSYQTLVLSAKTASALERVTEQMRAFLEEHPDVDLADLAYTLHVGRAPHPSRRTVVCSTRADALEALSSLHPD